MDTKISGRDINSVIVNIDLFKNETNCVRLIILYYFIGSAVDDEFYQFNSGVVHFSWNQPIVTVWRIKKNKE